jgi:hypothetical protein
MNSLLNGHRADDSSSAEEMSPRNILRKMTPVAGFVFDVLCRPVDCYLTRHPHHALLDQILNMKARSVVSEIMKTLFSTLITLYLMGLALADRTTESEAGFKRLRRKSTRTPMFQKVRVLATNRQIELRG